MTYKHDPKDGRHFPSITYTVCTTMVVPITQEQLDKLNAAPPDRYWEEAERLTLGDTSHHFDIETYRKPGSITVGYHPWGDDWPSHKEA